MVIPEYHLISVKLIYSWDDVTTHLTGYKLKIKKVRENKLILDEIIPSTRKNMKVSGLLPSVKYKVDIATIRKERKSEFKTIAITTLPNPPKITGSVSFPSRSTGVKLEFGLFQLNEPIKVRNVTETEAFISLKRPNHSVSSYLVFVKDLNDEAEERRLRITRTKSTMHSFSLKSLSPGSTFLISVQSIEATQKSKSNIATFMTVPKAVEKLRFVYQASPDLHVNRPWVFGYLLTLIKFLG